MNPSTNKKPIKNGTFAKLQSWMNAVGVPHWDFHNVIPDKTGEPNVADVDWKALEKQLQNRKVVICLGTFVTKVMKQLVNRIPDWPTKVILIDHPSPRNRNFNDPAYEPQMLRRLKKELDDGKTATLSDGRDANPVGDV